MPLVRYLVLLLTGQLALPEQLDRCVKGPGMPAAASMSLLSCWRRGLSCPDMSVVFGYLVVAGGEGVVCARLCGTVVGATAPGWRMMGADWCGVALLVWLVVGLGGSSWR